VYVDGPILDPVMVEKSPFLQKPITRDALLEKVYELLHLPEGHGKALSA